MALLLEAWAAGAATATALALLEAFCSEIFSLSVRVVASARCADVSAIVAAVDIVRLVRPGVLVAAASSAEVRRELSCELLELPGLLVLVPLLL